jgi:uncharacterized membrane protein
MALARESLRGNWGLSVGVIAAFAAIYLFFQFFPGGPFVFLLVQGALYLGLFGFFLAIARGRAPRFADLFNGFRNYLKALGFSLLSGLIWVAWMLVVMAPALIVAFSSYDLSQLADVESLDFAGFGRAWLTAMISLAILIVPTLALSMTILFSWFRLAEDGTRGLGETLKLAWAMTRGTKWKFVRLQFRFLGWMLLTLLTFGIALLWLVPYVFVTLAHFYDDIRGTPGEDARVREAEFREA